VPRIAPFRGLVYDPAVAGPLDAVTTPPYDVISEPDRHRYLGASPFNVAHLDLSGAATPSSRSTQGAYDASAVALRSWRRSGVLVRASEPTYYAYEMRYRLGTSTGTVRGVFVAMEIEPPGGTVIPHEQVMTGPIEDRLALLRATHTHLSAVYGIVPGPVLPLAALLERVSISPPGWEIADEEGVVHRMWMVPGSEPLDRWLADQSFMIADGHHRYATALAYRNERHAASGAGPWDRLLTLVVDADAQRVPVLPYHRIQMTGTPPRADGTPVVGLPALLDALDDERLRYGTAVREHGRTVLRLASIPGGDPPTVRALHDRILDRVVPGEALRFTPDASAAHDAVRGGEAVAAWFLPPTTPARIRAAVDGAHRLPRKSTFFWPKPRTGMLFMPLEV
jgi:uncharacterized protein (DUF1015 family)